MVRQSPDSRRQGQDAVEGQGVLCVSRHVLDVLHQILLEPVYCLLRQQLSHHLPHPDFAYLGRQTPTCLGKHSKLLTWGLASISYFHQVFYLPDSVPRQYPVSHANIFLEEPVGVVGYQDHRRLSCSEVTTGSHTREAIPLCPSPQYTPTDKWLCWSISLTCLTVKMSSCSIWSRSVKK